MLNHTLRVKHLPGGAARKIGEGLSAQVSSSSSDRGSKPSGVFSPKLSRILPQKGAVSPSPAWLKKFEPTVIQNPMTIRMFFIIVIEKYLGKESKFKAMRTD
ncbi:hypothetical protein AVEN_82784-1 [Araneus ventricosus]|uniref:Uncharacterized protein n=1 Tax=Araneus ventricosus TaxID=182803 RepID=A0A4Y2D9Q2_ARAVE|nr:hypothetical protein AVEN_82784-1 [Araneus ventricosus]